MRLFGSIRRLIGGIACVIIGIVMISTGAGQLIDNAKTPYQYSDLELSDFKAGMMVEGTLPINYGCYEEVTKTDDNGKTDSVGSFYLIDAGDGFIPQGLMLQLSLKSNLSKPLTVQYQLPMFRSRAR